MERMKRYWLLAAMLLSVQFAYGAPSISTASGTFSSGNSITVTGSGFGTKTSAAPAVWDDVDSSYTLADGATIPTTIWPEIEDMRYESTDTQRKGTACYKSLNSETGILGGKSIPTTQKIYVSWWWKTDKDVNVADHSSKFIRLSDKSDYVDRTFSWSQMGSYAYRLDQGYCQYGGGLDWANYPGIINQWNFHEVWIDSASRTFTVKVNGKILNTVPWTDCTSFPFDFIWKIGFDGGGNNPPAITSWMDDIYADSTFARVMVGDKSTYSASTHFEMQIPTAWSASSISFKANQGSFTSGTAYLYVVDAEGNVNANGYPINIGSSGPSGPVINSVSGQISSGSSVTVTGSNFGTGDTTPLLWDDFERGTDKTSLPSSPKMGTWTLTAGGPLYTTAQRHSGNLAATSDYANGNGFVNIKWEPMSHATGAMYYQSYWFRYNSPTDGNCDQSYHCGQTKLTQLWGSYRQNDYSPGVMTGGFAGDWWATYIALENAGSYLQDSYQTEPSRNTWHQFEMYIKQSDTNVADGRVTIRIDGKDVYNVDPVKTRELSGHGWDFTTFFDGMTNWGAPVQSWIDNVYLSDTWAHIELGNAATYSASTTHETQIPTAWSGTSITFTANQGAFSGQTAYLYVVDANGKVNANGYPISVGGSSSATCGNGIKESGEQCDDGNTVTESCAYGLFSCTVCSSSCQNVAGATNFCGDIKCNSGETCTSCATDCGTCSCNPNWVCSAWSVCASGQQTRTCTDSNSCGTTTGRPALTQTCGSNEIIVDNRDASVSKQGAWESSSYFPGYYATDYEVGYTSADLFEWSASIQPGTYNVYAWWQATDGRPAAAKYSITHASGTAEATVDQQLNGGKWNLLGTHSFSNTAKVRLSATSPGGQGICADAVRFAKSTHAADADKNGCVSMTELSLYMNQWKSGTSIQLSDLMEAIRQWKQGC